MDYPVIFSAPMVKALLDGRKTMTRRLAWQLPPKGPSRTIFSKETHPSPWQKVKPGDRLWVRERCVTITGPRYRGVRYIADGADDGDLNAASEGGQWDAKSRPSIHMPRWASRLTLAVTATKLERLNDINGTDAIAEGLVSLGRDGENWHWDPNAPYGTGHFAPWRAFKALWESLHGAGSWEKNPELVALSFAVHKVNIDRMKEAA